ncbi:hypothetical protein SCAR479_04578 [Seiridium cardinale]|uniref:Uncharacterized protein n=1 Tax=Seiridium cardinale TaxID=138064 RepID=A0ABR2XY41_9PEZI
MAALAPAAPAGAEPIYPIEDLPPELQNLIWEHVNASNNPQVVHQYFRINVRPARGRSGRAVWRMPRGYISVDPFHCLINVNRFTGAGAPNLVGLTQSMGLYYHRIRLPHDTRGARQIMTHKNRWHRNSYKTNPPAHRPAYVFVNWHHDVFYFSNEYGDMEFVGAVPAYRTGPFQFLSDNLNVNVRTSLTNLNVGMPLEWVRNVRKIAVRLDSHLTPPADAHRLSGFTNWIISHVNTIIARFLSLRRIYMVMNVRDANCGLHFDLGNTTIDKDGFIAYARFLRDHRRWHLSGNNCDCRLMIHPPIPPLADPLIYLDASDNVDVTELEISVWLARLLNPALIPIQVYWVVDTKS